MPDRKIPRSSIRWKRRKAPPVLHTGPIPKRMNEDDVYSLLKKGVPLSKFTDVNIPFLELVAAVRDSPLAQKKVYVKNSYLNTRINTIRALVSAGFEKSRIVEAFEHIPVALLKAGFSVDDMLDGGIFVPQLIKIGWSAQAIKKAGIPLSDFALECELRHLVKAGYSAPELINVGFSKQKVIEAFRRRQAGLDQDPNEY